MTGARTRTGWTVRCLPSGRWQAVITTDTGRVSLGTFPDQQAAEHAALDAVADQRRGRWHDPRKGAMPLTDWLGAWLARRAATGEHGARYQAEATRLVRLHINPHLGHLTLHDVTVPAVRAWHRDLQAARLAADGQVGLVPAKAYRLLRAAMADAARDELIDRNPCDIPGAGVERSSERPLLTVDQIDLLVRCAPEHRQAMIHLAAWGGLRFGELAALQRRHIDLLRRTVTVQGTLVQLDGRLEAKAPKSAAGRRAVALPAGTVRRLDEHLAVRVASGAGALVFLGVRGGVLRRGNWVREWSQIKAEAGVPAGVRFHDLRHAAGTLAAQSGATQRELQARLGHASPDAARRYQHAAELRDRDLAERLELVAELRGR